MEDIKSLNVALMAHLALVNVRIELHNVNWTYYTAEFCNEVVSHISSELESGVRPNWIGMEVILTYLSKEDRPVLFNNIEI